MIYQTIPYVRKMYYLNADLYRYWIGRPDQSVQSAALAKRHADQILVVDKGRIVQRGTHDELMKQDGIYRRFISGREQAVGWKLSHI